ncbi:hypothetical protein [Nakamurella multipartita]|uniref:hypothetical protein n=1 Tax=Nakamurella multipartita TaxID=53461 RepID=UPI0002EDC944|nr:hypothetical protein [Nakamurella multipartita]
MTSLARPDHDELDDNTARVATIIAMAVRNALEEIHGGGIEDSLTDRQMAKINPIVRNAVATTVHAYFAPEDDVKAARWLRFQAMLVPDYWERPRIVDDYYD